MDRQVRVLFFLLGGLILFVVASRGAIYLVNLSNRQRANDLLREVRGLQVGKSSMQAVEGIVGRFHGGLSSDYATPCPLPDSSYSVRIANDSLIKLGASFPHLRRVGLQTWGAVATILIKEGRVCYTEYSIESTLGADGQELKASVTVALPGTNAFTGQHVNYQIQNALVRAHIHQIKVYVNSDATLEQREHAFDFDLSCLARFGGCKGVCELMPSAWLDYQEKAKEQGESVPADELADPRCKNR
jgi:hypothetical protein